LNDNTELLETLDQIVGKSEDYQKGFLDGLKHDKGVEIDRSEEEEQRDQPKEAEGEINIKERYPLDTSTISNFNKKRLEYEIVIFFKNRKNDGAMDTHEVLEAIWGEGNMSSTEWKYKKVQQTMTKSKMLNSKGQTHKQYFLRPDRDKEIDKEVLQKVK